MSHISIFKHKITDLAALQKVCIMKGYQFIKAKEGESIVGDFYRDQKYAGIAKVVLPKWRYPLVIDEQGQIHYDNFGSEFGSMDQFGDMLQDYNMEVVSKTVDTTLWDNISIEKENGDVQMRLTIY